MNSSRKHIIYNIFNRYKSNFILYKKVINLDNNELNQLII